MKTNGGGGPCTSGASDVSGLAAVVYSCGRNGVVNESGLQVERGGCGAIQLVALRSWRCPAANFLERLLLCDDGDLVVMGFVQVPGTLTRPTFSLI